MARDTAIVYVALWRRLIRGEQPDSAFVTEPVRFSGARSLAPNAFALGIDRDTGTMVLHQLVTKGSTDMALAVTAAAIAMLIALIPAGLLMRWPSRSSCC